MFQLTDDELTAQQSMLGLDTGLLKSYLFFAVRLHKPDYSRSKLAVITRAVNRLFSIPVLIVFAHGDRISKGEQTDFACQTILLDSICYISKGMVVHADERVAQGLFRMEDVVSEVCDDKHPKRFAEGKHLDSWLPACHKWLEWGSKRAPQLFSRPTFPELHEAPEKILVQRSPGPDPKAC